MVLATASDTGPAGERPRADGTTNAETSELGVAASTTHDAASAVTGKEGMISEKYLHTPHLSGGEARNAPRHRRGPGKYLIRYPGIP